jgi:hypothetical protein
LMSVEMEINRSRRYNEKRSREGLLYAMEENGRDREKEGRKWD